MIKEFMDSETRTPWPCSNHTHLIHRMDPPPDQLAIRHFLEYPDVLVYQQHSHPIGVWAYQLSDGFDPKDGRPRGMWPNQKQILLYWAYCPDLKGFFYQTIERVTDKDGLWYVSNAS